MTIQGMNDDWGRLTRMGVGLFIVLVVLAMFPYSHDPTGDIKWLITSWAALGLLVVCGVEARQAGARLCRPPVFLVVLGGLLALELLASLLSGHRGHSLAEWGKWWSLFALYLVAAQVYRRPEQVRGLMLTICGAMALASLYAFGQRIGIDPFPWSDRSSEAYTNLPGTFGNPNYAAHALILAIIMAVYLAWRGSMVWCLGFAGVFAVHLWFTGQRAGWLGLGAALALVVVAHVQGQRAKNPVRRTLRTLVIAGLIGLLGFGAVMGMTKVRTGTVYPLDLSLLVRYKSYVSAARMAVANPVLGYGTANYEIDYPPFWTPYEQNWFAQEKRLNAHVHNDLLETAIDAGLPAAGLYLAFLVFGMAYGTLYAFSSSDSERRRLGYALAAVFCAFFVDGLFGFNVHVPVSASIIFLMAGCLEGLYLGAGAAGGESGAAEAGAWWRRVAIGVTAVCALLSCAVFLSQCYLARGSTLFMEARGDEAAYEEAEALLAKGEYLAPWNWLLPRQRGLTFLARRDWDEASRHFARSLKRNPHYISTLQPAARAELSRALGLSNSKAPFEEVKGAFDAAGAYAERALTLCPMYTPAHVLLGRVTAGRAVLLSGQAEGAEEAAADWRKAADHFEKAIGYGAPDAAQLYGELAKIQITLGEGERVEESLTRAIQSDYTNESNWPVFYGYAQSRGDYDGFVSALKWQLVQLQEDGDTPRERIARAYVWLGKAHEDSGNVQAAQVALRNAVNACPELPVTWNGYAQYAARKGGEEGFRGFLLDTAKRLLGEGQQPIAPVAAVASVWTQGPGALVKATASLVTVVQKAMGEGTHPKHLELTWAARLLEKEAAGAGGLGAADEAMTFLHLGMIYRGVDAYAEADAALARAMPGLPVELKAVCAEYRADTLAHLDRRGEAVDVLQEALAVKPDAASARMALARHLVRLERKEEAAKEYEVLLADGSLKAEERQQVEKELAALGVK